MASWRVARRERLHELCERSGAAAIVLRRPANFAWYTGGADNRVDHASPFGVADLVVTTESEYVLTSTIEGPRLREEQTPDLEVVEYPWFGDATAALRELTGDAALAADYPLDSARHLAGDVAVLRRVLDPDAVEQLRAVGRDATAAIEEAASAVTTGMSEREAAALLAAACTRRGISAPVLLAATDDRVRRHRHPLPTAAPLERRCMLVVSAERGGLYANLTRLVSFEEPDRETARRQAACEEILRRMREATHPGRTLADLFDECTRFYRDAGFPDEYRLHHQGGLTGYASREVIATASTREAVAVHQAFAWNPSIAGAKAEETFVLTEAGPEVVAPA
jgi:antitoxin VapB